MMCAVLLWWVLADDDKCETLFCRSGLRDTASRAFADLPVYRASKAFLQVRHAGIAGERHPALFV